MRSKKLMPRTKKKPKLRKRLKKAHRLKRLRLKLNNIRKQPSMLRESSLPRSLTHQRRSILLTRQLPLLLRRSLPKKRPTKRLRKKPLIRLRKLPLLLSRRIQLLRLQSKPPKTSMLKRKLKPRRSRKKLHQLSKLRLLKQQKRKKSQQTLLVIKVVKSGLLICHRNILTSSKSLITFENLRIEKTFPLVIYIFKL